MTASRDLPPQLRDLSSKAPPACVVVVDVGGEEFDVAPGGLLAEIGDERRHYIGVGRCRERTGRQGTSTFQMAVAGARDSDCGVAVA